VIPSAVRARSDGLTDAGLPTSPKVILLANSLPRPRGGPDGVGRGRSHRDFGSTLPARQPRKGPYPNSPAVSKVRESPPIPLMCRRVYGEVC
jgi:hypothetical protein